MDQLDARVSQDLVGPGLIVWLIAGLVFDVLIAVVVLLAIL